MSWYLRVIEQDDHRWACRWGSTRFDTHEHLMDALAHLHRLALNLDGAAVFVVHLLSGDMVTIDPTVTTAVPDPKWHHRPPLDALPARPHPPSTKGTRRRRPTKNRP
jgi:hypothetical protein